MTAINLQIQEDQQIPSRRNLKRNTPRSVILGLLKTSDEEKILNAARRGKIDFMCTRTIGLFHTESSELVEARQQWQDMFQLLKEKWEQSNTIQ